MNTVHHNSNNPIAQARLVRAVNEMRPRASWRVGYAGTPNGTLPVMFRRMRKKSGGVEYVPTLYPYVKKQGTASVAGTINVTAGAFQIQGRRIAVSPFDPDVEIPASTTWQYIWFEPDGSLHIDDDWPTRSGAHALLWFRLARVYAGSDGIIVIERWWEGGTPELSRTFPVAVTQTGGGAGSFSTACDFTYEVRDLMGYVIATDASPDNSPARIFKWPTVAGTMGEGYYDDVGEFYLWSCNETKNISYAETALTPCDAPGS